MKEATVKVPFENERFEPQDVGFVDLFAR